MMRAEWLLEYKGVVYTLKATVYDNGDFRITLMDSALNIIYIRPSEILVEYGFLKAYKDREVIEDNEDYNKVLDEIEKLVRESKLIGIGTDEGAVKDSPLKRLFARIELMLKKRWLRNLRRETDMILNRIEEIERELRGRIKG